MRHKKSFSKRERQVATLMLLGLKSKDVAKVMGISQKTVATYLSRWKQYIEAPLMSNYAALLAIKPIIEESPDYSGVHDKYRAVIAEIVQSDSTIEINSLIKTIQEL